MPLIKHIQPNTNATRENQMRHVSSSVPTSGSATLSAETARSTRPIIIAFILELVFFLINCDALGKKYASELALLYLFVA